MWVGLGILLLIIGAVLAFAVNESVEAVDLVVIGWIFIAGGGLALLISAIQGLGWMGSRSSRARTERQVSPGGDHVVEETRID